MFAVVEFDNKKEFFVVPLIWLSDDKKSCSWPKNVSSEKQLQMLIMKLTAPKESWTKYSIRKVHNTTETLAQAQTSLELILAESSTSATDLEKQEETQKSCVETHQDFPNVVENTENSSSENTSEEPYQDLKKNKKQKKRKSNTNKKCPSDSESDYHTREPAKKKNKKSNSVNTILNFTSSEEELLGTVPTSLRKSNKSQDRTEQLKEVQVTTPIRRFNNLANQKNSAVSPTHSSRGIVLRDTNSTPTGPNIDLTSHVENLTPWQQSVTQDLTKIKLVQEQQSTLLSQIWQTMQVKNVQALTRPPDVPEFPINRKRDFGLLEEWLEDSQNFNYMRTRLASIGGSTIRNSVMNMLKFVISNRVGMAFNWAGNAPRSPGQPRKHSFKETLTYKALNEAVKISFQGKDHLQGIAFVGELTDRAIGQACQDWLKLSKHRYNNAKT